MISSVLGIDFASVDGNHEPDFGTAYANGLRVVGIRRSYAWLSNNKAWQLSADPCYERYAARARTAGITVIPYYFPSFANGAPTPADQVAAFKAAGGNIIPGVDLPPCLDVEWGSGGFTALGQSRADVLALILEHVACLNQEWGASSIYTSYNQWYDLGSPPAPELAGSMLWLKTAYRLRANQPVDKVLPRDPHVGCAASDSKGFYQVPEPWAATGWRLQQYQGDALGFPGFDHTVDMNRCRLSSLGDTGPHVADLQRRLAVAITGDFDAATELAVRARQAAKRLTVDGVVGPSTFAAVAW